jgi:DNA-binding response OmpR family regulator
VDTGLKILIVEDNDELRETLTDVLTLEGHHITSVDCAEHVAEIPDGFDLFLLDLNLPGEDGLSLAKRIRMSHPAVGIIMLTARHLELDRKTGYDSGADIYMLKPASLQELCAAIQSLSRRLKPVTLTGAISLDYRNQVLQGLSGQSIQLTTSETALLNALCLSPDQKLENWQLIDLLLTEKVANEKATIELKIVRLRKKLTEAGAPSPTILSIRSWGYRLTTPIRVV